MKFSWQTGRGQDVAEIVALAQAHFQNEIETVFRPDPIAYARNITQAIVTQFFSPGGELLMVANNGENTPIVAYMWVCRGQRSAWSDEEMALVKMVHVNLGLGVRDRIGLIQDMIAIWETWSRAQGIQIICSTTMRRDQEAFLRLHERAGYDRRGSYCYKRLDMVQAGLPIP